MKIKISAINKLFITDILSNILKLKTKSFCTNEYFKTGTWHEMDLSAYESEQKQQEQLAVKVREL